jgi:hypothetical protein
VTVLIRPEQLELVADRERTSGQPGTLGGRVMAYEYYGHDAVLRVKPDSAAGPEVIVRTVGCPELAIGAAVTMRVRGPVVVWTR